MPPGKVRCAGRPGRAGDAAQLLLQVAFGVGVLGEDQDPAVVPAQAPGRRFAGLREVRAHVGADPVDELLHPRIRAAPGFLGDPRHLLEDLALVLPLLLRRRSRLRGGQTTRGLHLGVFFGGDLVVVQLGSVVVAVERGREKREVLRLLRLRLGLLVLLNGAPVDGEGPGKRFG
jgi:hypothetical protein